MTLKKGLKVTLAPDPIYTTRSTTPTFACPRCCCTEEDVPLVPYHEEDGAFVLCWRCHGYIVGPLGRRLCQCRSRGPCPLPRRRSSAPSRHNATPWPKPTGADGSVF